MIAFNEIVKKFIEIVPDSRELIDRVNPNYWMELRDWPVNSSDLYKFLLVCMMGEGMLPRLRYECLGGRQIKSLLSFIDGLASNPDEYIQNAPSKYAGTSHWDIP